MVLYVGMLMPMQVQAANVLVISNSNAAAVAADLQANTAGHTYTSLSLGGGYVPVPADFTGADVVLLFENGKITATSVAVGDAVHAFQQGGGGVVFGTYVWQDWGNNTKYAVSNGWGALESVSPLDSDTQGCEYNADSMGTILDPAHPVMAGVNVLTENSSRGGTQISAVGTPLALWSTTNFLGTDDPLVAVYEPIGFGRTVAISLYPTRGTDDAYQLWENALAWAAAGPTLAAPGSGPDDDPLCGNLIPVGGPHTAWVLAIVPLMLLGIWLVRRRV